MDEEICIVSNRKWTEDWYDEKVCGWHGFANGNYKERNEMGQWRNENDMERRVERRRWQEEWEWWWEDDEKNEKDGKLDMQVPDIRGACMMNISHVLVDRSHFLGQHCKI